MSRTKGQSPKVYRRGTGKNQVWVAEWRIYLPDGKTKHRSGTFGFCSKVSRQEALTACHAKVAEETATAPRITGHMSLHQFWEETYLPVRSRRWAYNTRLAMKSTWRLHVKDTLGTVLLENLSKNSIEMHLIKLADKQLGFGIVDRVRILVKAVCEEAVENDAIRKNPARKVEVPSCKPQMETRSLTVEEAGSLLANTTGRDHLIWHILLLCGPRIGEVLVLEREDVTPAGLNINKSALLGKRSSTKNRKSRLVRLPPGLRAELEAWMEALPAGQELLFPNRDGGIYHRNSDVVQDILKRGRVACGVNDLTFRMCRTSCATLHPGDITDVRASLGHHSVEFTMKHYRRPVDDRAQLAANEFEKTLDKVVEIRRKA